MEWMESKYLYLGLMVFSIAYPLAQSFEWRLSLYKKWKRIAIGTLLMMLLFIPWDVFFTHIGVWWFDDKYISGFKIALLPIEEWLFFLVVPYACLFIHEVLKYYIKRDLFAGVARTVFLVLGCVLLLSTAFLSDRTYSFVTFLLAGIGLILTVYFNPVWLGRFLATYIVSWLPFLLVNGALTGSFTETPVVHYNPDAIIGFRVFTIPIEDSIYNLLMLLIVMWGYERKTHF